MMVTTWSTACLPAVQHNIARQGGSTAGRRGRGGGAAGRGGGGGGRGGRGGGRVRADLVGDGDGHA